jgi:hypothetical protein
VAFFTCKTGQSKVKRRLFCFASEWNPSSWRKSWSVAVGRNSQESQAIYVVWWLQPLDISPSLLLRWSWYLTEMHYQQQRPELSAIYPIQNSSHGPRPDQLGCSVQQRFNSSLGWSTEGGAEAGVELTPKDMDIICMAWHGVLW